MTTNNITPIPVPDQALRPRVRFVWVRRTWNVVRSVFAGFDAAAMIAHGTDVPHDHRARLERQQEIERLTAVRFPRT